MCVVGQVKEEEKKEEVEKEKEINQFLILYKGKLALQLET